MTTEKPTHWKCQFFLSAFCNHPECKQETSTEIPICGDRVISPEILKILCDTVIELTRLRQMDCHHLLVENYAPSLLQVLIETIPTHLEFPGGQYDDRPLTNPK